MSDWLQLRTLMMSLCAVDLLLAIVMITISLRRRTYPGFHFWTVGISGTSIGGILLALRGVIPDFFSIILGNMCLVGFPMLVGHGLVVFLERPSPLRVEVASLLFLLSGLLWGTYVSPSVTTRIIFVSITHAWLTIFFTVIVFRYLPTILGRQDWLLLGSMCMGLGVFLSRIVVTLLSPSTNSFLTPGPAQGAFVLLMMLALTTGVYALINLNAHRLEVDLSRSEQLLKEKSEALEEANSQLKAHLHGQKRFMGDITHELASPLVKMRLGLEILQRKLDGKNKDRLQGIAEEQVVLSNLVNELLSYSRAELAPDKVVLESVSVQKVVDEVIARENRPDVELEVVIEPGLEILAQKTLVTRALGNLLRNAIRYAASDGPISIAAKKHKDGVLLKIEDSGPGVSEENLPYLFQPFFREDLSRSRNTGGFGLGMAIVKTCIEACQGTVKAHNGDSSGLVVLMELKSGQEDISSFTKSLQNDTAF